MFWASDVVVALWAQLGPSGANAKDLPLHAVTLRQPRTRPIFMDVGVDDMPTSIIYMTVSISF